MEEIKIAIEKLKVEKLELKKDFISKEDTPYIFEQIKSRDIKITQLSKQFD